MRIVGFIFFLTCLVGSTVAWALRAQALWNSSGFPRTRWAWLFAASQLAGLLILFISRNGHPEAAHSWSRPLVTVLFVWYLLGIPLFLLLSAGGVAWRLAHWTAIKASKLRTTPRTECAMKEPPHPPVTQPSNPGFRASKISRREALSATLHCAPALLSLGSPAIAAWQLEHFRIRRLDVPLPNLPQALHGYTITHLSDTHVGRFTHGRVLSAIVEATQSLNSDLICFTGDLINFSLGDLPPAIEMLQALKARHGVYLCEGNHDLMHNAAAFRRALEKAALRLLFRDSESVSVGNQSIQILGLPWGPDPGATTRDDSRETHPMRSLAHQIRPGAFPILLAHHPHAFDEADAFRLTLSGHTHGGQLMLTPRFGCGPAFYRYWSGLHLKENRALCVSNGVGNWFPIRVSAPAEIVHLTLKPAEVERNSPLQTAACTRFIQSIHNPLM